MICVTGKEATVRALSSRFETTLQQPALRDEDVLLEVRLDALEETGDDVFGLLSRHGPRVVACCRPRRQGGWFEGTEEARLQLLERAVAAGAAWVDLEADLPDETLARFAKARGTRRLLSWHDFEGVPTRLEGLLEDLIRRGTEAVKMAVSVSDAAQLARMLEAGRRHQGLAVLLGMGDAGLLSRCRYRSFGSAWTYVAAEEDQSTAAGQLSLSQALELGLPASASAPFLALLGGPQVMRSPGMRVYNRVFRRRGFPWSYVPVISAQAEVAFELLRELGALGLSVTMPHKQAVLGLCRPEPAARLAGAANSVRFEGREAFCTNTDIEGVSVPLRRALRRAGIQGGRALILGSGGAAHAARLACSAMGLTTLLSARSGPESDVPWEKRAETEAEVLVNATPVGGDGATPWPAGRSLDKRIVFDLALIGKTSALLEQAEREGAIVLGPEEMWVAQGAAQMGWITGARFEPEELREMLR